LQEGHHLPVSILTWFAMFSPADSYWPELFKAALPRMTTDEIWLLPASVRARILGDYPDYAAQLFWFRWQAFWKHILNGKAKPFGHIADFFIRVEFQMRGSPHVHMMLWVLEAANTLHLLESQEGRQWVAAMVDKFIKTWTLPVELGVCIHMCAFVCAVLLLILIS
jgi:hypothetical protein